MRIEVDADELDYEKGRGLEILVKGFEGNIANAPSTDSQVYIERYDGEVRIHVWNNSGDPVTFKLVPIDESCDKITYVEDTE